MKLEIIFGGSFGERSQEGNLLVEICSDEFFFRTCSAVGYYDMID